MSSLRPEPDAPPTALVEAWRTDRSSPAELRRRYARFTRLRGARSGARRLPYWVVMGVLLGAGLAQAATLAPWRWLGIGRQAIAPTPGPPAPSAPPPARLLAPLVASGAAATPPLPDPPVSERAHAPLPSVAPSAFSSTARVNEQWQHAAGALRDGDFERAQQSLLEIEQSTAANERSAARLARAQLLASHGHVAEARALLVELQSNAQSELMRRKASEVLARISESSEEHRSSAPTGDTQ